MDPTGKSISNIQLYILVDSNKCDLLSPLMVLVNDWVFVLMLAPFLLKLVNCPGMEHYVRCIHVLQGTQCAMCLRLALFLFEYQFAKKGSSNASCGFMAGNWSAHEPHGVARAWYVGTISCVYELAGLYPCAHVCRHWILRDALNRLFCGMERSGRYLWHGSDVTKTSASTLCDLVRSRCESSCLLLRSREAAEDIYQHGMRFLRVHKLLTSLAQRSGCRDSVDYADLEIPCTDLAGTI